jgi:sec-independent protein translocase protein TatA
MFRNAFEGWHIIILVLAFVVLFGYKKLPDAARSIGRSMRIFKAETKGLRDGEGADDKTAPVAPPAQAAAAPAPAAPAPSPTPVPADIAGPPVNHPSV